MRQVAQFLIHLYPATWRQRYGDEFAALLEDKPPTLSILFDLIKGATRMHLAVPSFPKLALLLSVTGLLAGLGVSYLVTPGYVSTSTAELNQTPGSAPADLRAAIVQMQQEILSRTSLFAVITDQRLDLYRNERARQPIEDVIETMRNRDLQISLAGSGPTFQIRFSYSDPVKARDTVHALLTRFQDSTVQSQRLNANWKDYQSRDQIGEIEMRLAAIEKRLGIQPSAAAGEPFGARAWINFAVIDPPSFPINPVSPDRSRFAYLGFGAGFIAALIITVFRRRVHPAISFPTVPA